jgi:hypothetical protein
VPPFGAGALGQAIGRHHRVEEDSEQFLLAAIEGRLSNFRKAVGGMKLVRHGVGWQQVDFTDDRGVTQLPGAPKEIGIERSAQPVPSIALRDDHAIDVEKPVKSILEPEKMPAVIVIALLKCQQEGCARPNVSRNPREIDQMIEPLVVEGRGFSRVALLTSSSSRRAERSP